MRNARYNTFRNHHAIILALTALGTFRNRSTKRCWLAAAMSALVFGLSGSASATSISFVGADEGVGKFVTAPDPASQSRPFDSDGDNTYGTDGWILFGAKPGEGRFNDTSIFRDVLSSSNTRSPTSYAEIIDPGEFQNAAGRYDGYQLIEKPGEPGTDLTSGVAYYRGGSGTQLLLKIRLGNIPATGFRLGLIADNIPTSNTPLKIIIKGPGVPDTSATPAAIDSNPDMFFFDIEGFSPGHEIEVWTVRPARNAAIGGLTFDTITPAPPVVGIQDSFDYGDGMELHGQSGGSGFAGSWAASEERTQIVAPGLGSGTGSALEVAGGGDTFNLIRRQLESPITTTFYASVLVQLAAGTIAQDDWVVFWFAEDKKNGGWEMPNLGLKLKKLMGRVHNNALTEVTPVLGTTYRLVGKYTHDGQVYSRADVWVDPGHNGGVEPPPDATNDEPSSFNEKVTHVGIRTTLLDANDRFLFGSLKLGSSWSDVVPAQ